MFSVKFDLYSYVNYPQEQGCQLYIIFKKEDTKFQNLACTISIQILKRRQIYTISQLDNIEIEYPSKFQSNLICYPHKIGNSNLWIDLNVPFNENLSFASSEIYAPCSTGQRNYFQFSCTHRDCQSASQVKIRDNGNIVRGQNSPSDAVTSITTPK